jgi:uracil-DNA glycosylase
MKRTIILIAGSIWLGLALLLGLTLLLSDLANFLGAFLPWYILIFVIYSVILLTGFLVIFYLFEVGEAKDWPFFGQNMGFESRFAKPEREVLTDLERAEYNINKAKIQPRNVLKEKVLGTTQDLSKEPKFDPIQELIATKSKTPKKVIEAQVKTVVEPFIENNKKAKLKSKEASKDINLEVSQYEQALMNEIKKEDNLKKIQKKMADEKLFNIPLFKKNKVSVGGSWAPILKKEVSSEKFQKLMNKLDKEYQTKKIYPQTQDIFKAFELTDYADIKVVIIGKIPFYRKDQADGLAFSTKMGVEINQTTQIIINEAIKDVDILRPDHGSLESWAKQGVFLLNSSLTASSATPAAHLKDWQWFTNKIIDSLIKTPQPKVFVLWGEHGALFAPKLKNTPHLVIKAPNPSPLSAAKGFYGSQPFSKINKFLGDNELGTIDWNL